MDEPIEELEPLFDYTRVQPFNALLVDDDCDSSPVFRLKKRKTSESDKKQHDEKVSNVVNVIDCDDVEDEEDWLPPPPKNLEDSSKILEEDSTLKALRLKKQELASFAQSAEEVVRAVEESVRKKLNASLQTSAETLPKQPLDLPQERAKLVIFIQDKEEKRPFRVYMDDTFERIFKMYADKIKVDVKNLVFSFDGDRVTPAATPNSLGMDEEDVVEVYMKSS